MRSRRSPYKHIRALTLFLVMTAWHQPTRSQPVQDGAPPRHKLIIKKVCVAEYVTGYLYSDSNFYTVNHNGLIKFDYGERKIIDVAAGFNLMLAIDDQGYVWTTRLGDQIVRRLETDTTGAPFNRNTAIYGYANAHTSIRNDGSLWYFGDDTLHLCHPAGSGRVMIRPIRISPPGMKIKKVVMSLHGIYALTTTGQVWQWESYKGFTPIQKPIPRPAIDLFVSEWDYIGVIIPDAGGSRTMGYPYIWGSAYGFWGGSGPANQPLALKQFWKMTAPVKEISANTHTIHFIDSLGRMFGIGDNVMGEIGNGTQLVNQYNYHRGYGWTFVRDEFLTGAPPIQIGKGIRWKKLFSDNFYAFYRYATDEHDSLWFWGRDKALVSGRGFYNMQEAEHPDVLDVLSPLMVHPLTAKFTAYNFTMPSISAGEDQTVSGTTTVTLQGRATPPLLVKASRIAFNGIDTVGYHIVSWNWTKVKGGAATIVHPNAPETTVTGLSPGTYVFNLMTKDDNTGTQRASVTIKILK